MNRLQLLNGVTLTFLLPFTEEKPTTASALRGTKTVTSVLEAVAGGDQSGARCLDAALEALAIDGAVERRGARSWPTPGGRQRALSLNGLQELPGRADSTKLRNALLVPTALGLGGQISPSQRALLATSEGLQAEVLRQHYRLDVPVASTLARVRDELGWALLTEGASRDTVARARKARVTFKSGAGIADVLAFSAAGVTSFSRGKGLAVLAATVVAARGTDAGSLRLGVLRRWGLSHDAGEGAPAPSSPDEPPNDDFAQRVLSAARSAQTGRYDERHVFISHVFRLLADRGDADDLAAFKRQLLSAYRRDELILTKADMPQTMNLEDLESSTVMHGDRALVFIEH